MSASRQELMRRHGSPLFVYDGDLIVRRYRRLRAAMPERCSVHYAMKANPSLALVALLVEEGAGLEIASEGELVVAAAAGCSPDKVLYAGPGKRDSDLEAAVLSGLSGIHCESAGELARLNRIAGRLGRRIRCGIRVHASWSAGEERSIIGGASSSKFGLTEEETRQRINEWRKLEYVEITGLHVFNASNVLDAEALLNGASRTLSLAADLVDLGLPLERVDIGGGLGVPYSQDERELDIERFGEGLEGLLAATLRDHGHDFRIAIEPGRWLVAEAGEYLATVVDLKRCHDDHFAVLDGGVHHMIRPALVGQSHPVRRVGVGDSAGSLRSIQVVGPLCTSLDSFGVHNLPALEIGDVLAVGCAGAYGFTEAMPQFLSHAVPAEVVLFGGQAHLTRPRREAGSHLEGQLRVHSRSTVIEAI